MKGFFDKAEHASRFPMVAARVSRDEEQSVLGQRQSALAGAASVQPKFPHTIYELIDRLTLIDPYLSKYCHTTCALGNSGHTLEIDAPSEARAAKAIKAANDFAARCFPLAGGMDGLVNTLLSQMARAGGLCVEWVPDLSLSMVRQAYPIPIKTLEFRYDARGELVLHQKQNTDVVPLNMAQTTYCAAIPRDNNPYPIPPMIAALESCATHRMIVDKIKAWMDKVSALGLLLATCDPPPRLPGEPQDKYDERSLEYLKKIADATSANISNGLAVAFSNIQFQFHNTQASAQGAKDILQIVLQGLFAGLHRDPVFFGWNWNSTETYAKIMYEEMQQGIQAFQMGVKRALEHGHRLNLALQGMGDIGVSVSFNVNRVIDRFEIAESGAMDANSMKTQIEAGIIDAREARRILGHDDVKAGAGEYVATFNRDSRRYELVKQRKAYPSGPIRVAANNVTYRQTYERNVSANLTTAAQKGSDKVLAWILMYGLAEDKETWIRDGRAQFIDAVEDAIDAKQLQSDALSSVEAAFTEGKAGSGVRKPTDKLTDFENAAIAYLALISEPHQIGTFLSRSERRNDVISNALSNVYDILKKDNSNISAVSAEISTMCARIVAESSHSLSEATMSRARSWGSVSELNNQGVEWFMVDGPRDDRKCDHCWAMVGRVFSVSAELARITSLVGSNSQNIGADAPWLNVRYPGAQGLVDLQSATDEAIQSGGFAAPPYHGDCRDYVVPVIR